MRNLLISLLLWNLWEMVLTIWKARKNSSFPIRYSCLGSSSWYTLPILMDLRVSEKTFCSDILMKRQRSYLPIELDVAFYWQTSIHFFDIRRKRVAYISTKSKSILFLEDCKKQKVWGNSQRICCFFFFQTGNYFLILTRQFKKPNSIRWGDRLDY